MRAFRRAFPLGLGCLLLSLQSALGQAWTVLDGSRIRFTALQQGSPIEGKFGKFTADITFDPDNLGKSLVDVRIDTSSIDTGHKDRDTLLRSAAFFDVGHWPSARFQSRRLSRVKGDAYQAKGELTIRDVTKPVVLPFTITIAPDPGTSKRLLAEAKGELTISRLDYGIGQGEWTSTKTVGDKVVIDFELQASRQR
jgi:polyisoprenoid-binding protein YceI